MKKFSFSLEKVMDYKDQVLDNLLNEHAAILEEIRLQEKKIEQLRGQYTECSKTLNEKQREGVTVGTIYTYENYLEVLDYRVREEQRVLVLVRKKEEVKRQQVLEARKESASLGKLKEKKRREYDKEVMKEEEKLVEEFVSNARTRGIAG